jgi:hypothetical protein
MPYSKGSFCPTDDEEGLFWQYIRRIHRMQRESVGHWDEYQYTDIMGYKVI